MSDFLFLILNVNLVRLSLGSRRIPGRFSGSPESQLLAGLVVDNYSNTPPREFKFRCLPIAEVGAILDAHG